MTKYTVRDTGSGYAVVRADGMYAEFLSRDEAECVSAALESGHADESDYDWSN